MVTKDILNSEIDFLDRSKDLCLSYEQISMMRMNGIKKGVLATRDFYADVTDVYFKVKQVYKKRVLEYEKKRVEKKKKKVAMLLSADNKLYGDILHKVFALFVDKIQAEETDVIIVGSLGKSMYEKAEIKKPYTYITLPHADSELTLEDLKDTIVQLAPYSTVDIYFGKYVSYVNQKAVHMNITGDEIFSEERPVTDTSLYYFEPDLEKIMLFFETQMISALLKQSVFEGQLARYASRIGSMEEALHAIKKEGMVKEMQKRKILAQDRDKKQNEQIVQLFYRPMS